MQENSPAALARIQQLINKIVLVIAHGPIAAAKRALAAAVKRKKKIKEREKEKRCGDQIAAAVSSSSSKRAYALACRHKYSGMPS